MEEKEKLKSVLQEMAEEFDSMADEYEKRIEEYEDALDSINEAIAELSDEEDEDAESPDGVMSEILMEQDDFEDAIESAIPNGLREGVETDSSSIKEAIEAVQKMQDMRERMEDSMGSYDSEAVVRSLIACRDLIDTALVQTKADYASLLHNIERISSVWDLTE